MVSDTQVKDNPLAPQMTTSTCRLIALHVFLWTSVAFNVGASAEPPQDDLRFQKEGVRLYDQTGRYQGRSDKSGRVYDSAGRLEGRRDASQEAQRLYDAQGKFLGRTDPSGRSYDAQGRFIGRLDADGRMYDAQGKYRGRTDGDGRRYDAQGRLVEQIRE